MAGNRVEGGERWINHLWDGLGRWTEWGFKKWAEFFRASLVAQMVKRLPVMRETWVWSLGWEDPLEKETATHSSTLAWKTPWMHEPVRLQSMGSQRVRHNWATSLVHRIFQVDKEGQKHWNYRQQHELRNRNEKTRSGTGVRVPLPGGLWRWRDVGRGKLGPKPVDSSWDEHPTLHCDKVFCLGLFFLSL